MKKNYYSTRVLAFALGAMATLDFSSQAARATVTSSAEEPIVVSLSLENQAAAASYVELDNRSFLQARGKVGEKIVVGTVHVKAVGLTSAVTFVPSGAVEGIYTTDVQQLPAGDSETDITIYYEAKKIGKDEGKLYLMMGDDVLEQINLKGLAIDPAIPPTVKLTPEVLPEFSTEVGTPVKDTIVANLVGLPSSVNVKVTQDEPAFSCNTGMLYYSVSHHNLVLTFNPKKAGTYEATVTLTNEFFEPIEIKVKGTATEKENVKPEVEGDELPLSYDHPVKLLNEGFNKGEHNRPLALEGWKNLAALGNRAWWGYSFPEYDPENAGEFVAKVTSYDSKVEYGRETDCQMLLITPPLDFKNAASKVFTFRVMGKNMTEGMPDKFMFCNVVEDGGLWALPVEGVEMPSTPDQNGEWIDYHVDLSNLDLGEVSHMGFFFAGLRGTVSSTMYFIDDVSFGRTDLPVMTVSKQDVTLSFTPNVPTVSEEVTIEGKNLTEPIKLSTGGRDKASFELSTPVLPKEGGKFYVKFKGEKEMTHEAYVKLLSRGAATRFIAFFASVGTGLQTVETVESDHVEVVDLQGHVLRRVNGASLSSAMQTLPKGTYVVRVTGTSGTRTLKITK